MNRLAFHSTLVAPWTELEPSRLGQRLGCGIGDKFITFESDQGTLLRIDLFRSSEECFAFEEACEWSNFIAIGWGHYLYLVSPETRQILQFNLAGYFGHMYPTNEGLLVASAERLLSIGLDGTMLWQSELLGIDGVIVDQIDGDVIRGQGEWDPPGGWRAFVLDARTGRVI